MSGIPVTRENYLRAEFLGQVPDVIPLEVEMELPENLRSPMFREPEEITPNEEWQVT